MKNACKLSGIMIILFMMSFKPFKDKTVIVIDAAHGGKDFGVITGIAYEKVIVEEIARKIKALNKKQDTEIILIREGDHLTSLETRVEKINQIQPDLVISLHVGMSDDKAATGVQAYISEQNQNYEKSLAHAEKLIQAVAKKNLPTGEVKKANHLLLKQSQSPAVSLELGFLSNENEKDYLMSEKGQNTIAKRILNYLNK